MPARYKRSAWEWLVSRGEASGHPAGGYLPEDRILVEREKEIDPNLLVLRDAHASNLPEGIIVPGGQNMQVQTERKGVKILINRILHARASVPPVPTPEPAPTPETVPAPVDRSIAYMAEENRSESVYAQAFRAAKEAVAPLKADIRNLAAGKPRRVPGSDQVSMVNRSIVEGGGITVDGKVSPAVAARRFLGLPMPEQASQSFVDRTGRKVEGATDPRAKHENISTLVRRGLGLKGHGRPQDQRSVFYSKRIPELVFRTRAGRDQYDSQISGNKHDGKVPY